MVMRGRRIGAGPGRFWIALKIQRVRPLGAKKTSDWLGWRETDVVVEGLMLI